MKKIIIITLVLIVSSIVILFFFSQKDNESKKVSQIVTDFNIDTKTDINPSAGKISITGQNNQIIEVRNFKDDVDVTNWYDPQVFLIADGKNQDSDLFQIFYYDADTSIGVSLLSQPLGDIRLVAEKQLKERLGLSENEICKMKINVSTPSFVSEQYSGQNLGLSFCPDAVTL